MAVSAHARACLCVWGGARKRAVPRAFKMPFAIPFTRYDICLILKQFETSHIGLVLRPSSTVRKVTASRSGTANDITGAKLHTIGRTLTVSEKDPAGPVSLSLSFLYRPSSDEELVEDQDLWSQS